MIASFDDVTMATRRRDAASARLSRVTSRKTTIIPRARPSSPRVTAARNSSSVTVPSRDTATTLCTCSGETPAATRTSTGFAARTSGGRPSRWNTSQMLSPIASSCVQPVIRAATSLIRVTRPPASVVMSPAPIPPSVEDNSNSASCWRASADRRCSTSSSRPVVASGSRPVSCALIATGPGGWRYSASLGATF